MADKMSKLILPVKSGDVIAPKEFDVGGGGNTFVGTTAEWEALTAEQQNAYDCRVLTDDELPVVEVIDNLTSDSSTDALSAKQGKVLKGLVDSKSDTSHNHDDRYYTKDEENQIIDALQSTIVDSIYPVGSLYMSINSTIPTALATGRTWELLSGNYVLKTISSGTGGQASSAGATGSTTLTAAQSGVPAHSHGMNNHTHSIPALSGTAANQSLTGKFSITGQSNQDAIVWNNSGIVSIAAYGSPVKSVQERADISVNSAKTLTINASHSHSVTTTASTSGKATGSTANNTAANASQGHTHTAGMPQNIGVYVWKRTA